MTAEARSFLVHIEDDASHCRAITGAGFEEAALSFADDLHNDDDAVRVIVIDAADGRRQCFSIDLGAGEAEPCG